MKKMLFVYNPNTGGNKLRNHMFDILAKFSDADYEITLCATKGPGDARLYTFERAEHYELVVCCGGDGTLNEVVNGLMPLKQKPVLGYIPGGTTNDFAASLKLPRNDMLKAVDRILHPKEIFECDIGMFNERAFNYVAAFGAFTDVSYTTPQRYKNLMGYFAYLLEAISKLPAIHPFKTKIVCDDTVVEDEFILGMVSNSASVGGMELPKKHKVHMDDGIFEVLLVRPPQNLADLGGVAGALMTKNVDSPFIEYFSARELTISSVEPVNWTLDGEYGGKVTEAQISVLQQVLRICI